MYKKNLARKIGAGVIGIGLCIGAGAALTNSHVLAKPAAGQKPNIIFILADDLGYGDVSAYNKNWIPTPHIDSLGKSGVRFTDGYVSAAICAPSRAGLFTGRQGTRHGSEYNAGNGVNLDEKNMGEMLKEAGYATGAIGKWHLGLKDGREPLSQGFDEFFGLNSGRLYIASNHPDAVNGWAVEVEADLKTGQPLRSVIRGNKPVEEKEYLTEAFTREAVDFIHRHKDKPFFLYVGYNAPHAPLQTTKKYYDRFPNIKDHNQRVYAGMVSGVDDGVGAILAALKKEGLDDNTIVVFTSDNGCPLYLDHACSNGPLNGGKRWQLEGGTRVPYFIRWPGKFPKGLSYNKPVSTLDLYTTFATAAGGKLPQDRVIDGVDLLPYVTGKNKQAPHPELFWRSGGNVAVREGKWKLVVINKTPANEILNMTHDEQLLNHPPYAGKSPHGHVIALFDLEKDVGETNNIAKDHPDIVKRLHEKYVAWDKGNTKSNVGSSRGEITAFENEVVELSF